MSDQTTRPTPSTDAALPDYAAVERAAARLAGVAHRTPAMTSRTMDERLGATLFFKCENLQRGGAFKFRGAYNAIAALPEEQRRRGTVAFSSGNHAQAMALAGRLLGVPVTIVMPQDAPAAKMAATRGYGAEVVIYDRYTEDREAIGRRLAEERGLALIPPYDHADVIAGQGTATKELIEEVGPLDLLLVCLGGGGLLAGSALSAAALSPGAVVVGVEPEAGNDGQRSFRSGEIVHIPVPQTIADGAQTQHLGRLTFPIIPAARVGHRDGAGCGTRRRHAVLRRAHADRGRTDRLLGGGGGLLRRGRRAGQSRRGHRERRQRRHGADGNASRLTLSRPSHGVIPGRR